MAAAQASGDIDVLGIGNAIVDVLSHADDGFLDRCGLIKGSMRLIAADEADLLYRAAGPALEASGGSVANTVAGLAMLGARAGFIGKVSNDQFGGVFRHDIKSLGIHFDTLPANRGAPTARCLVFVTPDGQRTMCTYLGACLELTEEDIDEALVARAKITYLEGYLWDPPHAKLAFLKAAETAHRAGRLVSLSLSDPFCVDRHRAELQQLVENHIDILFANEHEICSLWQVEDFDEALQATRGKAQVAALTRSEKGSVVLAGDEVHIIDPVPVSRVVDSTGAGDQYAAGFLYGLVTGRSLAGCGRLASHAAAEVIQHLGGRPEVPLAEQVLADFV
ncbi:MAG: adenosine kinase [Pseudomonadota bacterium]